MLRVEHSSVHNALTTRTNLSPAYAGSHGCSAGEGCELVSSDPSAKASGRRAEALARRTCFDGFRRRDKRNHGCPAFVAEATSAEQAKAVGLHNRTLPPR
jgi:hypothetical protein